VTSQGHTTQGSFQSHHILPGDLVSLCKFAYLCLFNLNASYMKYKSLASTNHFGDKNILQTYYDGPPLTPIMTSRCTQYDDELNAHVNIYMYAKCQVPKYEEKCSSYME
jgi:hypothetical protein